MEKTTYILGAGFSKLAGLPLINNFYFHSKDLFSDLIDEEDIKAFQAVYNYINDYSKVKNVMVADFYNIEELLSIIEMHSFVSGDNQIKKNYLHFLKRVIEISTIPFDPIGINQGFTTKSYVDFISLVYGIHYNGNYLDQDKNNANGIISLNYDLVLENNLELISQSNRFSNDYPTFGFEYGLPNSLIVGRHRNTINLKLAKIHGSVNFCNKGLPLIVPPTWNKTSNIDMQGVWKFAFDILSESNNLIFIGYSLPETDLYVKYLLINGIKNCDNIKGITVVCLDDDGTVEERYKNFFDLKYREKAFKFEKLTFIDWMTTRKKLPDYRLL